MAFKPGNRTVADLDFPSCLVIWSLRCAVHDPAGRNRLESTFAAAFGISGQRSAIRSLHEIVASLRLGTRDGLEIPPFETETVSEQETAILDLLAAIQARHGLTAYRLIDRLVHDDVHARFADSASDFAITLANAGHCLKPGALRSGRRTKLDFAPANQHPLPDATARDELRPEEIMLLTGQRTWIHAYLKSRDPRPALAAYFECNDLSEATASLHTILHHASIAAIRVIIVHCPKCPALSRDEARLLCATAAVQRDDPATALACLSDWLPTAVAHLTLPAVKGLARSFANSRLLLPVRAWSLEENWDASCKPAKTRQDTEPTEPTLH